MDGDLAVTKMVVMKHVFHKMAIDDIPWEMAERGFFPVDGGTPKPSTYWVVESAPLGVMHGGKSRFHMTDGKLNFTEKTSNARLNKIGPYLIALKGGKSLFEALVALRMKIPFSNFMDGLLLSMFLLLGGTDVVPQLVAAHPPKETALFNGDAPFTLDDMTTDANHILGLLAAREFRMDPRSKSTNESVAAKAVTKQGELAQAKDAVGSLVVQTLDGNNNLLKEMGKRLKNELNYRLVTAGPTGGLGKELTVGKLFPRSPYMDRANKAVATRTVTQIPAGTRVLTHVAAWAVTALAALPENPESAGSGADIQRLVKEIIEAGPVEAVAQVS